MSLDGVLVIDKPAGMTSHDVVSRVRKMLGTRRVGHAGTLDPDATGLLLIGVGRATRFLSYAQSAPKRYRAVARFGAETTTQDSSGEVVAQAPPDFGRTELDASIGRFVGDIDQVPPMVSAVKVGGERLYKKARRGEEIERDARRVTIYRLDVLDVRPIEDFVDVTLDVTCSAGTYVRTLAHDLGRELRCGAHLVRLRRTATAGFDESDAIALEDVGPDALLPLAEAVRDLPRVEVPPELRATVRNGRPLPEQPVDAELVAVVQAGDLLGVYRRRDGRYVPDRVVAS